MTIHITRAEFEKRMPELIDQLSRTGETILVIDGGKTLFEMKAPERPPLTDDERRRGEDSLKRLRGTLLKYERPFDPVGEEDWEVLK